MTTTDVTAILEEVGCNQKPPLFIMSFQNNPSLKKNKKIATTSRVVKSIRVSAYHDLMFKSMPGNEFPGVLVRMLLDEYFAGKLPQIKEKFEDEVKKQKQLAKMILAKHNAAKIINQNGNVEKSA